MSYKSEFLKVDLRSDTVTQPTPDMRAAMLDAPLGDDVFADDPSVNALQDQIASLLGFEGALFMPTGTQSNLCAIMAHCQRGDEYIVGQMAHTYRWEGGGAAVLGSVQPQPLNHQPDGTLLLADIADAIKPDDAHFARTKLLALENTLGGKLLPFDYVKLATELAQSRGLTRHLDGARLFNAAVAQAALAARLEPVDGQEIATLQAARLERVAGKTAATFQAPAGGRVFESSTLSAEAIFAEARRIAQCFDSVSVCFSKGLGAPVGSALCGSREFLARAHRIRKMAGGGMRQSGLLAAAASYALDHQVARLADDHALAQRLADGLSRLPGLVVEPPQTNILFVDLVGEARARSAELIPYLAKRGVLATGLYRLRFVTHLDVDAAAIDHTLSVMREFLGA